MEDTSDDATWWRPLLVATFAVLLTVGIPATIGADAAEGEPGELRGELRVETTGDEFAATMKARPDTPAVQMRASTDADGIEHAQMAVGGAQFWVRADDEAGFAEWGGRGQRVTEAQRTAADQYLRSFAAEHDHRAAIQSTKADGLAYRLALLISEAPVGLTIPDGIEVPRTEESFAEPADVADVRESGSTSHLASEEECEHALETTGVMPASCQQDDDDGIMYWGCGSGYYWVEHDAVSHCFQGQWAYGGPDSNDCLGACGRGCDFYSVIVTQDCGDHDICGRIHGGSVNPWDSNCGDEYWDADDDFLWGSQYCFW